MSTLVPFTYELYVHQYELVCLRDEHMTTASWWVRILMKMQFWKMSSFLPWQLI